MQNAVLMAFTVTQTDQDWLVTDVHNDSVIFGPGEISEVINNVMGLSTRYTYRPCPSPASSRDIRCPNYPPICLAGLRLDFAGSIGCLSCQYVYSGRAMGGMLPFKS